MISSGMPEVADGPGSPSPFSTPSDDVAGCLYVYPARDGVHDANVTVMGTGVEAAFYDVFRRAIASWLTSNAWPFDRPLYVPLLT